MEITIDRILKNTFLGVFHKFLCLILKFVLRAYLIKYLGDELVGLNSVLLDWMSMLNLSSLGIEVAIQFSLYAPIANKNEYKIAQIVKATQFVYRIIGIFIFISGIILMPVMTLMLKDNTFDNWYIFGIYVIMLFGVSGSYFWCYKRAVLQAFEEVYIINFVDIITETLFTVLDIAVLIVFRNIYIYVFMYSAKLICQHYIVSVICDKRHKIIKLQNREREEEKRILSDLKDVAPLKIANYVYGFTDNMIISKFLGLTTVTLYSNYMLIINSLFSVSTILVNSTKASFGIKISQNMQCDNVKKSLDDYIFVQFIVASFSSIIFAMVIEPFISLWIGTSYIAPRGVMIAMSIELFCRSMYQPLQMVFEATGSFKQDKIITIAASVANILISIILVIKIGLIGAIVGTLFTDIFIWIYRANRVQILFLKQDVKDCIKKWSKIIIVYLTAFLISIVLVDFMKCKALSLYLQIIINAVIGSLIMAVTVILFFAKTEEFNYLLYIIKKFVKRG